MGLLSEEGCVPTAVCRRWTCLGMGSLMRDLSNNRISTEGALAFSKGLQINNTLKILRFVKLNNESMVLDHTTRTF